MIGMTTRAEQQRFGHWSVIVPAERYREERLYQNDTVEAPLPEGAAYGDRVLLVADVEPPVIFAVGEVRTAAETGHDDGDAGGGLVVAYTRRFFDDPEPADERSSRGGRVDAEVFDGLIRRLPQRGPRRSWLVSVDLPIEADTAADAVRQFWSYVRALGPAELPAFVTPSDDELAMQVYVLGEEANLDPEEDED
jgi:hypothetical protein